MSRARVPGDVSMAATFSSMAAMDGGNAEGHYLQACLELNESGHEGSAAGMVEEAARMDSVQAMNDLTLISIVYSGSGAWRRHRRQGQQTGAETGQRRGVLPARLRHAGGSYHMKHDAGMAVEHFRRAAVRGHAWAALEMGRRCPEGRGLAQDRDGGALAQAGGREPDRP